MDKLTLYVDGIGWWSPGLVDWASAAALLRGDAAAPGTTVAAAARVLPPNERRRAPEPVLLACDVADQAASMSGRATADLPCVFASMHGDIGTTDSLCTTLAMEPLQLSPTKFHNSVHNAPAGYWTVATQCHAASTSIAAWRGSFAAGLLEAAVEVVAEDTSVLFAAYDIGARGPLVDVIDGHAPIGLALVLAPKRGAHTCAALHLRWNEPDAPATPAMPRLEALAATNPVAAALPLFVALARGTQTIVHLQNGADTTLTVEVAA
jgi:hypothetical protein